MVVNSKHAEVLKTIKLYINGQFVRTESGRSFPVYKPGKSKVVFANCCLGSRKDVRQTVEVATKAQVAWQKRSAYNRAQILYRMAEMLESRRDEFKNLFKSLLGWTALKADKQLDEAITKVVYYAGFCDKYQQVYTNLNPVAGSLFNYSRLEPTGVVFYVCSKNLDFSQMLTRISSIICGGNSVSVIMGQGYAPVLAPLAEVIATSDVPAGVVNLITADSAELLEPIASHMDIHSVTYDNGALSKAQLETLKMEAIANLKRVVPPAKSELKMITDFNEVKTVWSPVGV